MRPLCDIVGEIRLISLLLDSSATVFHSEIKLLVYEEEIWNRCTNELSAGNQ